jgi:hypothetical protein
MRNIEFRPQMEFDSGPKIPPILAAKPRDIDHPLILLEFVVDTTRSPKLCLEAQPLSFI